MPKHGRPRKTIDRDVGIADKHRVEPDNGEEITAMLEKRQETNEVEVEESDSRILRSSSERDSELREMPWRPARLLPDPNPVDGIDFRYVRVNSAGSVDNLNLSQALREQWVPVKREECPELGLVISDAGTDTDNIVLGGMMLCKRDKRIGDIIRKRADEESRMQVKSIDEGYLNEQSPGMKKFSDKSTRVTFGGLD